MYPAPARPWCSGSLYSQPHRPCPAKVERPNRVQCKPAEIREASVVRLRETRLATATVAGRLMAEAQIVLGVDG